MLLTLFALGLLFWVFNTKAAEPTDRPDYTETTKSVHYNWGDGGPGKLKDNFKAYFDQSQYLNKGDYFIQTYADDGVIMTVDGQSIINREKYSWSGLIDRAVFNAKESKNYSIQTTYSEGVKTAAIFSDIVPFGDWLGYYYDNETLSGAPKAAKVIKGSGPYGELYENNGQGSPVFDDYKGFPSDHFSVRYVTAKRLPAGDYVLRTGADDSIEVYIDGKKVLNEIKSKYFHENAIKVHISDRSGANDAEKDVHWIEVRYKEGILGSKVECLLQPYHEAVDVNITDGWVGEFYNNESFSGNPVILGGKAAIEPLNELNFTWGTGSPSPLINSDHFSAKFIKKIKVDKASFYKISALADNGLRVYVDGRLYLNSWNYTSNERTSEVWLNTGTHTVKIEFYEQDKGARLIFHLSPVDPNYQKNTKAVHYNWGQGSPSGVPKDNFYALFNQSQFLESGDYFIQAIADDGLSVNVNNDEVINQWDYASGKINHALLTGVKAGTYNILTAYHDGIKGAAVFSDIVPFGDWLGYYYDNETFSGAPKAAKVIKGSGPYGELYENNGQGSPVFEDYKGFPSDHFSVRYVTAKRLPAGDYVLRTGADDSIEVYIDGKKVLNEIKSKYFHENAIKVHISDRSGANDAEKDVHWIEVRYKEGILGSKVECLLQPYHEAVDVNITDGWVGEFYNNESFSGNPVILGGKAAIDPLNELNFTWGTGSPSPLVNPDHFSAVFSRKINIENSGYYLISALADNGLRVYIDNKLYLDSMAYTPNQRHSRFWMDAGVHDVKVEYVESTLGARLIFNLTSAKTTYTATQKAVHYNWKDDAPAWDVAPDNFSATFDQTQNLNAGDYFIQTLADDGVKVTVDGQLKINRWDYSSNNIDRALLLGMSSGSHKIITEYHDGIKGAALFSDIVPFGNWLAYYYPNDTLSGTPDGAKVIAPTGTYGQLLEDNQTGSPLPGVIPADHFSARYVTAKHIAAGDYVIRAGADDGIQVYIDGKLVLDRFTNGGFREDAKLIHISDNKDTKDVHWIEVRYKEASQTSKVQFYLQTYSDAKNLTASDGWLGEIYPNENLTGDPVILGGHNPIKKLNELNFNWGSGSPSPFISPDGFSGRFVKQFKVDNPGYYNITAYADNGIRVYVDNNLVLDSWYYTSSARKARVELTQGTHKIEVQYYEHDLGARLIFDIQKAPGPIISYTNYSLSLSNMLSIQMAASPKTDAYGPYAYVSSTYIKPDPNDSSYPKKGTVNITSGTLNVRQTADINGEIVGSLKKNDTVTLLSKTTDGKWYKINYTWKNARSSDVKFYLDPSNFDQKSTAFYQFLKLSASAGLDPDEVNEKILKDKGILKGHAQDFIDAAKKYNINEIYLISHALLETGNGTSTLATGYTINGKKVYNMYGIGAKDSCPITCGAQYAYDHKWFTVRDAIIGGAQFVSQDWIHAGQDTLYKMRWNPAGAEKNGYATHQYATDIGWAVKQTSEIVKLYGLLNNYTLIFDVPKYK